MKIVSLAAVLLLMVSVLFIGAHSLETTTRDSTRVQLADDASTAGHGHGKDEQSATDAHSPKTIDGDVIFEKDIDEFISELTEEADSRDLSDMSVITPDEDSFDSDRDRNALSRLSKREREQLMTNLEATFLNIVGLKSRPRPGRDITIPQYMLDLYRTHLASSHEGQGTSKYSRGLYNSNTIRSFFQIDDKDDHPENVVRLKFNVSSLPGHEVLQAAELRLYREEIRLGDREHSLSNSSDGEALSDVIKQPHRIDVYQIIRPATAEHGSEALTRLIDTRVVHPTRSRWESFDITPALQSWRTHENHGLEVRFSKVSGDPSPLHHVRLKRSTRALREEGYSPESQDKQWQEQKPLLVTYSDDPASRSQRKNKNKKRHRKRSTDKNKNRKKREKKERRKKQKDKQRKDRNFQRNCRRHSLYVDFRDVGWTDWIVAPVGYDAFYCDGECPFHLADHFNTTNHAVVQNFVHSVDPTAAPKPCCVPTELGETALLYVDEQNKIVLKNYKEMVVEACGCR